MAKNVIFAIIWIAVLFFIAWPLAAFCAGIWVIIQVSVSDCARSLHILVSPPDSPTILFLLAFFLSSQPFEACFPFVKGVQNFLEKLVTWPRELGQAVSACSTSFPAPF